MITGLSPVAMLGFVVAVVGVALGVGYGMVTLLAPRRTAKDRIRELTQSPAGESAASEPSIMSYRAVRTVTHKISELAKPQTIDEGNLLKRRLLQAGLRMRNSVELFSASRSILALVLPFIAIVALQSAETQLTLSLMVVLVLAMVGYYAPAIWVSMRISERQDQIMRAFPDALDLLVSSVEAGLGLDAAFRRVAEELKGAAPLLATELQQVTHEVTAGVPRGEALRNLDLRTGLNEIRQLVNVLAQADKFGTSVARALRIHSDMVRQKRMLAAEEKAAQISPKLTVVMILCIMPSLFVVLLGPAAIQIYRQFLGK